MKFATYMLPALCATAVAASAQEAAAEAEEEEAPSTPLVTAVQSFEVSGLVEVSAAYTKQGDDKDADTNVDTVEVDFGLEVTDNLELALAFLYEEGEDFGVDSAEAIWKFDELEGLSLHAGLLYLPFGRFETAMISDPLTLELGEISDGAFGLVYESDYIDLAGYVFAGDIKDATDDADEVNFVGCVTLKPGEGFEVWVAGLSDIAEAAMDDDIIDALDAAAEEGLDASYDGAAGIDVGALVEAGDFTLAAEYLAAVDDIEICGEKVGKPQTWSVDLAYAATDALTLAARYEGSKDFAPDEFPETQFGVAAEYAFESGVALAVEYMYGRFDKDEEGVRPDDRHMVTGKLAYEF